MQSQNAYACHIHPGKGIVMIDIYGFVSNTYGGGGVSYIGGYRFSNAVFIGLGVGISGEEHNTDYNAQTGPILRDWLVWVLRFSI